MEKGCVYFFKHVGLDPIKIGYSTNSSPINRFESFKTYAPFGAELVGFIMTHDSKNLETIVHQKFSNKRLNGEWFNISKEEAEECIKFYSDIEDIQEMSNFQIAWALKNKSESKNMEIFYDYFSFQKTETFSKKTVLKKSQIINLIKCNKEDLNEFMFKNKSPYKAYRHENGTSKGHLLYMAE